MHRIEVVAGPDNMPKAGQPVPPRKQFRDSLYRIRRQWQRMWTYEKEEERQIGTAFPAQIVTRPNEVTLRMMVVAEPKDLHVLSDETQLIVEGWAMNETKHGGESNDTIRETIYRRFERIYALPWPIDAESVQATIADSVLAVTVRRAAAV